MPLADGSRTTVHVVTHLRSAVRPRIVRFEKSQRLATWCREHSHLDAIVGGFFLRSEDKPLGDLWIDGIAHDVVPFADNWKLVRGTAHVTSTGELELSPRHALPIHPEGDLMQAGPLLVSDGVSLIRSGYDHEGFTAGSHQFDSDISDGRHPRAAIGINAQYIWSVACDGRSNHDAGMTLGELAEFMVALGATDALNLDGGSSASLVKDGKLLNTPRGGNVTYYAGRNIHTAIVFQRR